MADERKFVRSRLLPAIHTGDAFAIYITVRELRLSLLLSLSLVDVRSHSGLGFISKILRIRARANHESKSRRREISTTRKRHRTEKLRSLYSSRAFYFAPGGEKLENTTQGRTFELVNVQVYLCVYKIRDSHSQQDGADSPVFPVPLVIPATDSRW